MERCPLYEKEPMLSILTAEITYSPFIFRSNVRASSLKNSIFFFIMFILNFWRVLNDTKHFFKGSLPGR
jgi:hypothetical protein